MKYCFKEIKNIQFLNKGKLMQTPQMQTEQSSFSIGVIFWPTLALMYTGLIAAGIWFIWG